MKARYLYQICLLFLAGFLLAGTMEAQGAGVKKFPGEPVILAWNYAVTGEANITGFKIYQGPTATGPFTFTNTNSIPSSRTVTLPATFASGSVLYFYTARAYFTSGGATPQTVESVDSNAVEVDLNVVGPTGLTAK